MKIATVKTQLEKQYKKARQPLALDLSNQELIQFDEVFHDIVDFSKTKTKTKYNFANLNIVEIDLSDNKLVHFFKGPISFSTQKLESVHTLNLLNNLQLESIQKSILQIKTLMPNLKHLHISLSVEEDVSFIMEKMSNLESLNGIQVETNSDGDDPSKQDGSPEMINFVKADTSVSLVQEDNDLDKEYILAQASKYAQEALENVKKKEQKIFEYGQKGPLPSEHVVETEFKEELSADAAEKQNTQLTQIELDDTRGEDQIHHEAEAENEVEVLASSPKKDRQEMVKATQELLDYQDSIFKEDEEEVTVVKISREEQEEQLDQMENFCKLLVDKQQLSEILEENETDREKTMQKNKLAKQESNLSSFVSRNVVTLRQSSSSNLRNIGNGLQARDQNSDRDSIPFVMMPIENEEEVQDGVRTDRISCATSANVEFDGDSSMPQLRPEDLEEMASIFDKIRLIYKRREDTTTPQPKKLIAKSIVNKIDDLAVEFDKKLTDVMIQLSKILKNQAISSSQKWGEIEKAKFKLQSYCCETAVKLLQKDKLSPKEQKDLHLILSKLRSCMSRSFENLISLFYKKDEKEVQENCEAQIKKYNQKIAEKEAAMRDQQVQMNELSAKYQDEINERRMTQKMLENTLSQLNQERELSAQLKMELKFSNENCQKLQEELACQANELEQTIAKLEQTQKELEKVQSDLRQSETRCHEQIEIQIASDMSLKNLQKNLTELNQANQKLENELMNQIKNKDLQIETMKNEKEQDLQQNLAEMQKIEACHQMTLQNKDNELDRLIQTIDCLSQEIHDKNIEIDSLSEENQKYLDLIIKHSLGGIGNKTIRQQLNRNRTRKSNLDSCDKTSQFSNYNRSPLLPILNRSITLQKIPEQNHDGHKISMEDCDPSPNKKSQSEFSSVKYEGPSSALVKKSKELHGDEIGFTFDKSQQSPKMSPQKQNIENVLNMENCKMTRSRSMSKNKLHIITPMTPMSPNFVSPYSHGQVIEEKKKLKVNYTLKQLKDLITDIYLQKVKHDDKCINQNRHCRETMEQYLQTYLNQKYGLKSIVVDQATSIIHAIQTYQERDHEVLLFGKVLRHEVDEEFRYVQLTIKSSVQQLLKNGIRDKYPTRPSAEIIKMLNDIQNGRTMLDQHLYQKVVKHMYEPRDVEIILQNLKQAKQMSQSHTKSNFSLATENRADSRKKSREPKAKRRRTSSFQSTQVITHKVSFNEFIETILDFQLREHEKFLTKFMDLFKRTDIDGDGILSCEEFISLYQAMNIDTLSNEHKFNREINSFLDILDPYQCDKIILSDIVQLFSSYKVDIMDFSPKPQLHMISEKLGSIEESHFNSKNFVIPGESSKEEEQLNNDISLLEKELYAA